jgi:hypothetical protein
MLGSSSGGGGEDGSGGILTAGALRVSARSFTPPIVCGDGESQGQGWQAETEPR